MFVSNVIINIITNVILFVIGITIGFVLNKRLSDRSFLINEIFFPLYEELKLMGANISECRAAIPLDMDGLTIQHHCHLIRPQDM